MEPFFDGGLFEIMILFGFAAALNFIFLRRYALLVFSILTISSPVALFFIHDGLLFDALLSICIASMVLLNVILWQQKLSDPHTPLFRTDRFRKLFAEWKARLSLQGWLQRKDPSLPGK